jgi:hypothetical protein
MDDIRRQIETWKNLQLAYTQAREGYRSAWAMAYLASTEKTGDANKASADSTTSALRLTRDTAETEAAAAWQLLLVLRGPIESSRQPGQNFGEAA